MIIGIDLRCLPTDGSSGAGVAHAARFLVQELVKASVSWQWRIYLPRGAVFESSAETILIHDQRGGSLRVALRSFPCDALFVPSGSVPFGLSVPAIPWVHDVAIFSHPEWFPQSFLRQCLTTRLFRRGVVRAPLVFAVSQDTKQELQRVCLIDSKRIVVTHEGGDPVLAALQGKDLDKAKQQARQRLALKGFQEPFILCLGTLEPRKNISMLIDAWEQVQGVFHKNVDLVIAGRDGWNFENIYKRLARLPAIQQKHVHRLPEVDNALKRELLLAAELVVVPSFHEGFGLVALEAMQAGTAVIVSRVGALPEIVGENGILIDPTSPGEWSSEMVKIINSKDSPKSAVKQRSESFGWEQVARTMICSLEVFVDTRR